MENTLKLQDIETDRIQPNAYNFNRMTEVQLKELAREVKAQGYVIHHLVVRQDAEGYVILDGEHQWRAAKMAGLKTVPCQIVTVDDYDARRETYRRNLLRGSADPLAVGRMVVEMRKIAQDTGRASGKGEAGSNVAIAKDLGVSEATVRNYLLYVEAAELSGQVTGWPSVEEITGMGVREIKDLLASQNEEAPAQQDGATKAEAEEDPAEKAVARVLKALGKFTPEQRRDIKTALDKMVRKDGTPAGAPKSRASKSDPRQIDLVDQVAEQSDA